MHLADFFLNLQEVDSFDFYFLHLTYEQWTVATEKGSVISHVYKSQVVRALVSNEQVKIISVIF